MLWTNICFLVLGCGVASVLSAPKKVACAIDDFACTVLTADSLFKSIMKGRPSHKVPSSDPLLQNVISGRLDNINYNFTNAELHGLANCNVKSHSVNVFDLSWGFLLHCPQLFFMSNYEIFGAIGGRPIEGKGQCSIVHDKFRIGFRGGFEFIISPKGRPHLRINSFGFDRLEVVNNIKSEFSNLYNGDIVKSEDMHRYLNENWKNISFFNQFPTMQFFMEKMFQNINTFLQVVPANELFYREE